MKIKRFDDILNEEAKSTAKKEIEKDATTFIISELKMKELGRYDMILAIEKKFKDKDITEK